VRSPGSVARPRRWPSPRSASTWGVSPPRGTCAPGRSTRPGSPNQRGRKKGAGATGHGNPYLARILGEAAIAVSRTDTFLGERYRRIARRCGAKKAIVALGRSILVIIWHLLSDPNARFHDLGSDFYPNHTNRERKVRNHISQLNALGYRVTLNPAA
jgi:transposase